jgi:cytochrome c553
MMGPVAAELDDSQIRAAAEWYARVAIRPAQP